MLRIICVLLVAQFFLGQLSAQKLDRKSFHFPQSFSQKKFKKTSRRVYIANFRVYYQLAAYESNQDGGFGAPSIAKLSVGIEGPTPNELQTITDQAYSQFVERLQQGGFELVSLKEAASTKVYADWTLHTGGKLNEEQVYGYAMSTPTDFQYFTRNEGSGRKLKSGGRLGYGPFPKLSKQLDDAVVIDVVIVLPFIEFSGKRSKLFSKAKLVATPQLSLGVQATGVGMLKNYSAIPTHTTFVVGNPAGWSPEAALRMELKDRIPSESSLFSNQIAAVESKGLAGYIHTVSASHTLSVEADAYQATAQALVNRYLEACLDEFLGYAATR